MPDVVAHSGLLHTTRVHVEDSGGAGRPVVLIHGWPLTSQSWRAQTGVLQRAGYRTVAYDRRGFGQSDKPRGGYDYDTLAEDLDGVLSELDLHDVTLVGFSMGGGEVARHVARNGADRVRSVVFAAAVPPYLLQTDDNPEGPLTPDQAADMAKDLAEHREEFLHRFVTDCFWANGALRVSDAQRDEALAQCAQADQTAALGCMEAFGTTDFRADLSRVAVPTLVLHGDADGVVPLEGSGARTHASIPHSELVVLAGAPHGCNVSHADEFNAALLRFLAE